jgi:glucosylceramidase
MACNPRTENKSSAEPFKPYSMTDKSALVFTTADSTNLRLSITDTLKFNDLPQPVETDVCVFVDPSQTFQSVLGIGGALTDASAETFAKLPKDKQKELLTAYYDNSKGIGYSLARTQIHSCDFSSVS